MEYEILVVGSFEVNCAVLWNRENRAWIVDPGADAETLLDFLNDRNLHLEQVFLTHGHIDHLSALDTLLARHPAPVYLHELDARWAFTTFNRLPPYLHVPSKPASLQTSPIETLPFCGGPAARILHTPGHTPGGCCLLFEQENLLLSGDTLFAGSVGRTDLPGGDWPELRKSLGRLKLLPDEIVVLPGHGPTTTLSTEKRLNPYLTGQAL
jgi:glyoxylase-like metal-dependent hydrolase (beta-lactamase superfamily II)